MGKKPTQFRFEEDFIKDIAKLAEKEGTTVSEIVRNALRLYLVLHERMKGKKAKIFLEYGSQGENRCEVIMPWLQ